MKASLLNYENENFLESEKISDSEVQVVLSFGDKEFIKTKEIYKKLRTKFPNAHILVGSTAGEINGNTMTEGDITTTVMGFSGTQIKSKAVNISDFKDSYAAGEALLHSLEANDLAYVMVISDGGQVNGSELVRGINEATNYKIPVTGGLAGDGNKFESTLVGLNEEPSQGIIAAIGFYGDNIRIGHGSVGGWETFGPEMVVTKSTNNCLYEIENKSALELYKKYLGDYAKELPGSALLFPLSVKLPGKETPLVRTILSIDFEKGSMVFAGDIPEGSYVRFMKSNLDNLVDAATEAAEQCLSDGKAQSTQLALLVSCVGRKLVMNSRVEEEVEAVAEVLGSNAVITGFYSYGEICPLTSNSPAELHNQTMTITTLTEV
jgi:hypothetical protein